MKPKAVVEYSKHMSGVDHSDQLLSYIPLARRTAKWTTKLFMHLLTLTLIQANIVHNKVRAVKKLKAKTTSEFLVELGTALSKDLRLTSQPTVAKP